MRSRAVLGYLLTAALLGCAGCTTTPGHPAAARPALTPPAMRPLSLPSRSLPSPGCSIAAATARLLRGVRTAMTNVPGGPFGVVVAPDGRWAFVSSVSAIDALRLGPGGSLALAAVRTIPVPAPYRAVGEALTPDGRYLLAASGSSGAVVVSVARAEQGSADPVLGTLNDPHGGLGAIEVAVSPDGRFAFVTQERSAAAAVFNLHQALTKGFGPADFVGTIPLGQAPVGIAVSPDGRWLYATSELDRNARPGPGTGDGTGTLAVVDLRRAETDPASAVIATVDSGCNPVRVAPSADGSAVWVTARGSDDLLCFSTAMLRRDPAKALVAVTQVGQEPVGLMPVHGGTSIIVADSNRFSVTGAAADLTVVNVAAALAGKPAAIGRLPAGRFPREMALKPGGAVLLVTNFDSDQLDAVSVPTLP